MKHSNHVSVLSVPPWSNSSWQLLRAFAPLLEILLCFIALTSVAAAENWDRFRGPNGAGQSDDNEIPTTWEAENFLWKQPLPGVGHSSPVIWGDKLFLTWADKATGAQTVAAFDLETGSPLWQKQFDASSYHINNLNSLASSTPTVDAERVYLMWLQDGQVKLAALSHAGDKLWTRDVGPFEEKHGFGKSPVVIDNLVYVANDSSAESAITAFDSKNGDVRWNVPRESGITAFATPCLLDPASPHKTMLAESTGSGLTAIDPTTGTILWHGFKDDLSERCVGSPIVADGMVFISCGQGGNGKLMIASRPGDAQNPPQEVYRLDKNIPNVPTPLVAGDLLFLWHDRGIVTCYDVHTGKLYWRERVGGNYHSSPIRIGNRILNSSMSGDVVVLAADKEYKLLAKNSLNEEPCHATPAVADHRLFIRTESTLYCIGNPAKK